MINSLILTHLPEWTRKRGDQSEAIAFTFRWASKHMKTLQLCHGPTYCYFIRVSTGAEWSEVLNRNQIMGILCWFWKRFALTEKHFISPFLPSSVKWQWKAVVCKCPLIGYFAAHIHTHKRFEAHKDFWNFQIQQSITVQLLLNMWSHGDTLHKFWFIHF